MVRSAPYAEPTTVRATAPERRSNTRAYHAMVTRGKMAKRSVSLDKASSSPAQWRGVFIRVRQPDQCLPGAVHAALVSADAVLSTHFLKRYEPKDLNRLLQYSRGIGCPAAAHYRRDFQRKLRGFGLEMQKETGDAKAFDQLKAVVASPSASFPIVAVDLRFIKAYDDTVEFHGDEMDMDHAVVVLAATDSAVEFYDPTADVAHLEEHGIHERLDTPTFLRWWGGNKFASWERTWLSHPRARQADERVGKGLMRNRALGDFTGKPRRTKG